MDGPVAASYRDTQRCTRNDGTILPAQLTRRRPSFADQWQAMSADHHLLAWIHAPQFIGRANGQAAPSSEHPMDTNRQAPDAPRPRITRLLLAVLAMGIYPVSTQADVAHIPEHASAKHYGSGWDCDLHYRKANDICIAVEVPPNAYATDSSYGRGWTCHYGYRLAKERCEPVNVPENAHLSGYSGDAWSCDRGYLPSSETCVAVNVPEHAYLAYPSRAALGWTCDRGYREALGRCVAIVVPPNGYLTDTWSDSGWKCNRGYRTHRDACIAVKVPVNGSLTGTDYGEGWDCNHGFRATRTSCVALSVPDNAHIDFSGNDWECNRPYEKKQEKCVFPAGRERQ